MSGRRQYSDTHCRAEGYGGEPEMIRDCPEPALDRMATALQIIASALMFVAGLLVGRLI